MHPIEQEHFENNEKEYVEIKFDYNLIPTIEQYLKKNITIFYVYVEFPLLDSQTLTTVDIFKLEIFKEYYSSTSLRYIIYEFLENRVQLCDIKNKCCKLYTITSSLPTIEHQHPQKMIIKESVSNKNVD